MGKSGLDRWQIAYNDYSGVEANAVKFLSGELCKTLAREAGVELYPGELLAVGEEYSDNQCKSTNGGNPTPYDSFNDAYEIFLASVEI